MLYYISVAITWKMLDKNKLNKETKLKNISNMCLYKINLVYSENGTKTTEGCVTFVGGDEGRKNNTNVAILLRVIFFSYTGIALYRW